jgi:F420-dependent oxidoreductase-like protein
VKLGLSVGYWSSGPPGGAEDQIAVAEELGFDSVWTAEAYGSDALTPLAWWGSKTSTIKLGTGIVQMSARTPAATAMAAMTLDHLTDGRFILGLGVSGPQVVEGWYGVPYPKPLGRTREYVEIVRRIVAREDRVTFDGEQYTLPYPGGTGLGKPLKSTLHPRRPDIPIYLAAEGPKNVALAAEIADGWIPFWFSPKADEFYREALAEGFARPGARHSLDTFEVVNPMPLIIHPDPEVAADIVRPFLALYVGGMGSKDVNFHYEVLARIGWRDVCERVQELYLEGKKDEAQRAIPLEMVEDVALIGPPDKIARELPRWEDTVVTTMAIQGPPELLRAAADLVF